MLVKAPAPNQADEALVVRGNVGGQGLVASRVPDHPKKLRLGTRRPTKVCAACTPGKHAQAASQTLFMHQLGVIRVSLVTLQKSLKLIHKTNRFVFTGVHSFYT